MGSAVPKEVEYLKSLQAVRERSKIVMQAAEDGALNSFNYHAEKMDEVVKLIAELISVSPLQTTFYSQAFSRPLL